MIDIAHPRRLPWRRVAQTGPPRKNGPRRLLLLALAIALPLIWTQVASDGAAPVAIAGGDEDDEDNPGPGPGSDDDDDSGDGGDDDDDNSGDDDEGRPSLRDRVTDVRQELDSLSEEIEDLGEPVEEFETFDQCMYQLGVTQYGRPADRIGYVFGRRRHRAAFAIDIRGLDTSRYRFLAFPGEEPPSIECNEDAGGQFTN